MKYEIAISGEFSNIKGMKSDQTYFASISCTACKYEHPKTIVLTAESEVKEKGMYKCSFEMTCQSCKNNIKVLVKEHSTILKDNIPDKYDDLHEISYNPVQNDQCKLSIIETNGCEILTAKCAAFTVLTEDKRLFNDCKIDDKKCLAGEYGERKMFSIVNCTYQIKQIK